MEVEHGNTFEQGVQPTFCDSSEPKKETTVEFTATFNTETDTYSWMQQYVFGSLTCANVVIIQALDAGLGILHPQSKELR